MNKKFYTNYVNAPNYEGVKMEYEKVVDTLGFIPHNVKVENYINAGINLAKARAEQYDADSNVDPKDILRNPFRDVGIDFADVARQKQKLMDRIEAKVKKQKDALEAENSRKMELEKNLRNSKNLDTSEGQKKGSESV